MGHPLLSSSATQMFLFFALCKDYYLYRFSESLGIKQLTQSRDRECKEQTCKLHVLEVYNTRGKHSSNTVVTWSRAFWGHFNTPPKKKKKIQECWNVLLYLKMSGKMFWLWQKKSLCFFSPKFPPREKNLTFQIFVPMWDKNKHWNVRICCRMKILNFAQFFCLMPLTQHLHFALKYGWMFRGWETFCQRVPYV